MPDLITRGEITEVRGERVLTEYLDLGDGRVMSFCRYGAEDGPVLFYMHGGASCRFEPVSGAEPGRKAGFRIIAADRPGYGRSSPMPKPGKSWSFSDWPPYIARLADALGVGSFAVGGVSAGGPYSLATAVGLPDRVEMVFPINTSSDPRHRAYRANALSMRLAVRLTSLIPGFNRAIFKKLRTDPAAALIGSPLPRCDVDTVKADVAYFTQIFSEGLRQGLDSIERELVMISNAWGLDWGDARAPIHLLHGAEDPNLPFAREIAKLYPRVSIQEIAGGHLGGLTPEVWETIHQKWNEHRDSSPKGDRVGLHTI